MGFAVSKYKCSTCRCSAELSDTCIANVPAQSLRISLHDSRKARPSRLTVAQSALNFFQSRAARHACRGKLASPQVQNVQQVQRTRAPWSPCLQP